MAGACAAFDEDRAVRVVRAESELTAASGSLANPEAVAAHLGIGVAEVAEARGALQAYRPTSLDTPYVASDGDHIDRREAIGADDSGYDRVELSVGIERALRRLKPRDRKILLLRLALNLVRTRSRATRGSLRCTYPGSFATLVRYWPPPAASP